MIPDKIYCWKGTLGSLYASPQKQKEIKTEEYIRKDALLEWVKEKEAIALTRIGKLTYKTIIDKIESL